MMKVAVICAFLAVCVLQTEASCSRGMITKEKYKWSNKRIKYCDYNGMQLGIGSSFTDYKNCEKCSCSKTGLSCCGTKVTVEYRGGSVESLRGGNMYICEIGFYAGVFQVEGCKVVADKCEAVILNKEETGLCW